MACLSPGHLVARRGSCAAAGIDAVMCLGTSAQTDGFAVSTGNVPFTPMSDPLAVGFRTSGGGTMQRKVMISCAVTGSADTPAATPQCP